MNYETTYSTRLGQTYRAVQLPWDLVEEILGHPHEGTPEDDHALIRCLIAQPDCPAWVAEVGRFWVVGGWIDENGRGLIGPEIEEEEE